MNVLIVNGLIRILLIKAFVTDFGINSIYLMFVYTYAQVSKNGQFENKKHLNCKYPKLLCSKLLSKLHKISD